MLSISYLDLAFYLTPLFKVLDILLTLSFLPYSFQHMQLFFLLGISFSILSMSILDHQIFPFHPLLLPLLFTMFLFLFSTDISSLTEPSIQVAPEVFHLG